MTTAMDKNEIDILRDAMKNETPLNIFLDNRIRLTSKILDITDDELLVVNKEGEPMVQSLDTVSAIVF